MADELRMALLELLRKAELERDADFLREGGTGARQALLELEVTQHVGAERHERSAERTVGSLELRVSRVRDGSPHPPVSLTRARAVPR